jgi:hypothetical protein
MKKQYSLLIIISMFICNNIVYAGENIWDVKAIQ